MREETYKGLSSLVLENERLKIHLLPDYGGKMASFYHKFTEREFLFQNEAQTLELPEYAADFSNFDASGFDEMFPSIDPSFYPDGSWQGTSIPDHGEVWTLPWNYKIKKKAVIFSVYSPRFPYRLTKEVKLLPNKIRINYTVDNLAQEKFKFIWAAHALLNCNPETTQLILPPETEEVVNVEANNHLGDWGQQHSYPLTTNRDGSQIDLSRVEPSTAGTCEKFYIPHQLETGRCGVEYSDTQERLVYHFPVERVPYLGVWKTQGGYRGDYNIALEPCTGIYDDLYVADQINKTAAVGPQDSYSWYLEMRVETY